MSSRVYLLIDLAHGAETRLARMLRERAGVTLVDVLEGSPNLIVVLEAPERQKAAERLMGLLDCIDGMIENIQVLPVRGLTTGSHEVAGKRDKCRS